VAAVAGPVEQDLVVVVDEDLGLDSGAVDKAPDVRLRSADADANRGPLRYYLRSRSP